MIFFLNKEINSNKCYFETKCTYKLKLSCTCYLQNFTPKSKPAMLDTKLGSFTRSGSRNRFMDRVLGQFETKEIHTNSTKSFSIPFVDFNLALISKKDEWQSWHESFART